MGYEARTASARRRCLDVSTLRRHLTGDLDWITMKALEKDRARRYESAADFAADVGRHLNNEPVSAGPPSRIYRTGKFVRRHRVGVTVAGLALLGIVVFAGALAIQARRTAIARVRAERVSQFLENVLTASDPDEAQGRQITVRDVMDKGARRVEVELAAEPEVQSQLLFSIGGVYMTLGLYDDAERLLRNSVDVRKRVLGENDPDTLASMSRLALLYQHQLRYVEAETLHRTVLAAQRRVLGKDDPATLASVSYLGSACNSQGRSREAEALYREALDGQRRVLGPDHAQTLASLHNLSNAVAGQGREVEAVSLLMEAADAERRALGEDHPNTLMSMNNLGDAYRGMGRYDEAERLHRDVLERRRRVLGPNHPDTVFSMYGLAQVAGRRGNRAQALDWLEQAVEHGLNIADEMANDPNFKSLKGEPAFEALVTRARQNTHK